MPPDPVAARVAQLLQSASGWCRAGLTAPTLAVRERAAEALGALIAERLDAPLPAADARQLALPMAG